MAEPTSSCVSDDRLPDDIDTPGTSGSSKDLSEQVVHDIMRLYVVSFYGTSLKYIHSRAHVSHAYS